MDIKTLPLLLCVIFISALVLACGESYKLEERYEKGEVSTVTSQIDMSIDILVTFSDGNRKIPMRGKTVHKYVEKILETDKNSLPVKVTRNYFESSIETEQPTGSKNRNTLFKGNTYTIKKTEEGAEVVRSDNGKVRELEKKELAAAVTGRLHRILPSKNVQKDESWKISLDTVKDIYSINQKIEGTAKATLVDVEENQDKKKVAVIKLEVDVKTVEGAMELKYVARGNVHVDLSKKKILKLDSIALVSVGGKQKKKDEEFKYSGGGNIRVIYKSEPGKGEIDLTPPKNQEKPEDK